MKDIAEKITRNYLEKLILPSDPFAPLWNRENVIFRKQPRWNYVDCLMIRALLMMYDTEPNQRLLDYARRFTDSYVTEEGEIPTFRAEDHNLDNFSGGRNLLRLWKQTYEKKYNLAAEKLFRALKDQQPRTVSGNFWHKEIYPCQVWLDGVYMAFPFMAEYSCVNGDCSAMTDVYSQLDNIRLKMCDPVTGLYYHGYDVSGSAKWADSTTGLSPEFWLRSMGWLCAGLADICEIDGSKCGDMLFELLKALGKCATDDGMLLQLPLRTELKCNYPETSGTLLFAYAAMKSARLGIAGDEIKKAGIKAFEAVTGKYVYFDGELPVLRNICLMAGLGGEPFRDGSAQYYLSEQIVENDAKGIAPYLMAYTEYVRAVQS